MTAVESSKLLPGMLPPFRSSEFNQFSNIGNKENASQRPELQTGVARGHTSSANTVQPAAPIQIAPLATRQRPAVQQNNPGNGIRGRKRTITLVDGENIDLSAGFMADPQIIEAMRQRIIQLEDELEVLRHQPPAKRARIDPGVNSNASAAASSSAGPSTSSGKSSAAVDDKKKKMQLRKIFDQLKRQCKSDSCKFQGSSKTIKIDEILEPAEFDAIFKGKGVLIQPTPQNKPKSVVTIMTFSNQTQISELFGDELKQLKGNHWTKGGFQGQRFGLFGGGSSNFAKSVKTGSCDVNLLSIEVNYSKNNLKCSLKCTVAEDGYSSYGSYSGWDSD